MLLKCHQCGELISDHLEECPHCKAPQKTDKLVRKAGRVIKRTTYPRDDDDREPPEPGDGKDPQGTPGR